MTTRYEITAKHADGRTFLVAYTERHSGTGLTLALRKRGPEIAANTGISPDAHFEFSTQPRANWKCDGWTIGFTGRTQLDAKQEGAHPYIGEQKVAA